MIDPKENHFMILPRKSWTKFVSVEGILYSSKTHTEKWFIIRQNLLKFRKVEVYCSVWKRIRNLQKGGR